MPTPYNDPNVTYDTATVQYDGTAGGPQTPYPNVGVFIAFDDGPYVASPAWTDVSTMVREITIHRGRGDDFEQFDTGTAQLVLDNRARTFDPFYTSGAYYGKLTPRRQIRIVGQANGVNYDVFRGYVAGWPVQWSQAGKDSTVTIQAFDALGLMANEIVPTDWPDYITRSLTPTHYWKLNDTQNVTTILDSVGTLHLAASPKPFSIPPLASGLLSQGQYLELAQKVDTTPTPTASGISLSMWIRGVVTGATYNVYSFFWYFGGLRIQFLHYGNYPTDPVVITADTPTTTYTFRPSAPSSVSMFVYDQPKHLVMTFDSSGNATMYLNGRAITLTRTTVGASTPQTWDWFQTQYSAAQEISAYNRVLSATEATTLYNVGSGMIPETTTARMDRLIATTDYAAALTNFTAAPVATVSEIGSGTGVIPEMQLVADSEGGEIYVSKDGKITTTNRTDVFTATRSTVSQATFTDSGAGLSYGPELLIEYDGDAQRNDITVQFSGDGEVNAYNDYATTLYGGQATTIETQLADPTSAANLALVELGVEGSLIPRISPVDVSTNTAAASWQTILGLELLDRVTFKRTPTVGNQFNRDALVNAIDHQIVPGVWNTQLTLSMRYTSPETLDDDVLGLLDLNYLG